MYLERLVKWGIETSKYYVPLGPFNFNQPNDNTQMPNCTRYCNQRGNEACEAESPIAIGRVDGSFGNAKDWWFESPLPKGFILKPGSIAVFNGEYGHVAFVERVIDETHALITESQYDRNKALRNYKFWQKREVELVPNKATIEGVGPLYGFLYLPINDKRTIRDSSVEQVEIIQEMVNVRKTPNGELTMEGCYAPVGIYNVLDKQNVEGYIWFKLDENHWVREGDWTRYYSIDTEDYKTLYYAEVEKNKILEDKLNQIKEIVI